MSGSWVAVLVCITFFVVASSILLVACRKSESSSTGVVAAGSARTVVMVRVAAGGLDSCRSELLAQVGDGNMDFGEVLQGNEELGVGDSAVYNECTVGFSESCDRGAITGS